MKKTYWFPGDVKPVRVGVYETLDHRYPYFSDDGRRFQHWNGKFWGMYAATPENAEYHAGEPSEKSPKPKWRGLAEKTK